MKIVLALFGLLLLVVILGTYAQQYVGAGFHIPGTKPTVTIDGRTFTVDVAKTQAEQEQGLSGRNKLADNQGMLFVFDKPDYYRFWMKDMKFSIDIIYINQNKIITIFKNVPNPKSPSDYLPVYAPTQPADKVLEINGGLSNKYHFQVNDKVDTKGL